MDRTDEPKGGKKTGWTVGVPQGLGLRLVLFSIVMNANSATACTFSMFVTDIRLWRHSRYVPIHWGLKREGLADRNLIKFLKHNKKTPKRILACEEE